MIPPRSARSPRRVDRLADILGGIDPHDANQSEFRIDVDDGPVGGDGKPGVDVAAAVLIGALGGWMAEPLEVFDRAVGE
jgi:hypothetical protein